MTSESSDNTTDERQAKKLRSSEPDLKVILGSGDDQSILWYHSQALSLKSKYIDTMLAVPMKERNERVISFPDISIETWEQMMKFIDDPIAVRQMNVQDALTVVEFYDKYNFEAGRNLCSHIVLDYFTYDSLRDMEKKQKLDLDLIIDLVIVAHKANMEDALKPGLRYIWRKLQSSQVPYGRLMFTETQLTRLLPVLKYSKANWRRLDLYNTDLDLEEDDFAKEFVSSSQRWENNSLLSRCISHIELSGTTCNADGEFTQCFGCWDRYKPDEERKDRWGGHQVTFRVQYWEPKDEDTYKGWAIVRKYPPTGMDEDGDPIGVDKKKCWVATQSTNHRYPPRKGWVSCDPLAKGNPEIKYILNEEIIG